MGRMSREKGKRGEREVAQLLRDHGIPARRGVQYQGGPDSPDVTGMDGYHIEVKRSARLSLYAALEQAMEERKDGDVPVVFHRANQRGWVVVMNAADFLALAKAAA
jgi:Holliday junction resolvase